MIGPEERLMRVGIAAETAREIVRQIKDGGSIDTPLIASQNLADLPDAALARVNLGLGSAATQNSNAFATAAQGAVAQTAVQPGDLAVVATSGDYNDLTGKPVIPSAQVNSDWNVTTGVAQILNKPVLGTAASENAEDFATAAQGAKADSSVQPDDLGALATKNSVEISDIDATGSPSGTTYLRGDGTWSTPSGGGGGGIPEAPEDGNAYARENAGWSALGSAAKANSTSFATSAQGAKADTAVQPASLSTVATTGSYGDLTGRPTLGTASAMDATSFATATQGAKADTAVQPSSLATVATSGSYADLSNKPTIPAAQVNSDWNASSGVSQILNKPTLAAVATSGSYADLSNKPTIPAAQVNSDWSASSGVAQILNKPTIPTSPGGDFVGTTAAQTLTNKTLGAGTKEAVDLVADLNINVNSAPFMQVELAANATAFVNLAVGVSRSLWVNPATYTVTVPSGTTQVNFPDTGLPASKWSLITFTGKPGSTDGIAIYVSTLP